MALEEHGDNATGGKNEGGSEGHHGDEKLTDIMEYRSLAHDV